MRVLVTGSSGFIGSVLTEALLKSENEIEIVAQYRDTWKCVSFVDQINPVRYYNCDLRDYNQVQMMMEDFKPKVVFHLAADPLSRNKTPSITSDNCLATHNLLEECPQGTRFVFASSAAVYGALDSRMDESEACYPKSVYGASKLYGEHLVRAYSHAGKVRGTSLRLVANVGKGATHGLLPDLIRMLRGPDETLNLIGAEPGSVKPFVHVEDTVQAFIRAAFDASWFCQPVVNISNDESLSVKTVVYHVQEAVGIKKPITWNPERTWVGDDRTVRINSDVAWSLGWRPIQCFSEWAIAVAAKELWNA